MKLTIIRLENFSDQDRIDLQKIWPEYSPSSLQVDDNHRIYAARFNERLLAAVRVTLSGTEGALDSLRVREVTRRRGVGQYDAPRDKCAHFREINGIAAAFQYLQKNYNPTASTFLWPSTGKYR
ncbi:TPA: aspartate 1-decarboxylase autocleavage activator PanM [Escherichia coli]